MSKWNRPMRAFRSADIHCVVCGEALKPGSFGGWEHLRRVGITDPRWHLAKVAA